MENAGILFNTLRGLLPTLQKLKKQLACLKEWSELQSVTARFMDSVRWCVLNYSACIYHACVLDAEVLYITDTPDERQYDSHISDAMIGLTAELSLN